ncbi:response regulator transcription factor [Rhodopseudomonas pseudopalustris]|uniref:Regulatory protein, LuxR n=2 Tax=Rhodopseudomonas TaxID=1073 RepID=Q133H1_RHOPS|nr:LuxR C-terminal-related transcriptional regulator [Rhodopseudomonas pseudopalustris]ABE40768.1 regulatory protein, LuxR [Rhodopseudomonas palustris BisB5]MBB1092828.1 response regulator [Rhodopseudomonas palustris]SEO56982.1 two component transcriptional regulator, LuxR family [Rhodopseudomonas pseudopalustris]
MTADLARGDIFIIDRDRRLRALLSTALLRSGYRAVCFADDHALLKTARAQRPACILVEEIAAWSVLQRMHTADYLVPIICTSEAGSIEVAVRAMKGGAVDFIEKPFIVDDVVRRIGEAVATDSKRWRIAAGAVDVSLLERPLTRREIDVLREFVAGNSNWEASEHLGLSVRTIEFFRSRLIKKFHAKSLPDLVRIILTGNGLNPGCRVGSRHECCECERRRCGDAGSADRTSRADS